MDGIWYFVLLLIGILLLLVFPYTKAVLKANVPEVLYFISTYIFFFADVKSDSGDTFVKGYSWEEINNIFIVLGCVIAFIGFVFSFRRNGKYIENDKLKTILEEETKKRTKIHDEYYDLCSDNIKHIFSDFIATTNGNGRVSIYKHQGAYFTLLGRYSPNPSYNKRSNEKYPDDEGFISLGWEQGSYRINSIPAWSGKGRAYISYVTQVRPINEARLKTMSMKSRAFYIWRMDDPNHAQNPLGIIVFEKIDPALINEPVVGKAIADYSNQIMFLMKSMKSLAKIENE